MKIPNKVYNGQLILACFLSGKLSVGVGPWGGGSETIIIAHHMKGGTRENNHSIPTDAPASPRPLIIDRSRTSTSGCVQNGSKS